MGKIIDYLTSVATSVATYVATDVPVATNVPVATDFPVATDVPVVAELKRLTRRSNSALNMLKTAKILLKETYTLLRDVNDECEALKASGAPIPFSLDYKRLYCKSVYSTTVDSYDEFFTLNKQVFAELRAFRQTLKTEERKIKRYTLKNIRRSSAQAFNLKAKIVLTEVFSALPVKELALVGIIEGYSKAY